MQRPPKRSPVIGARQAGLAPGTLQKERVPITSYGIGGSKPHPSAPYTFINHNSHPSGGRSLSGPGAVPGCTSDAVLPPVEPQARVITFGAADAPASSGGAALVPPQRTAAAMPSFGHQPRVSRASHAPVQLGVEGVRTGEEVIVDSPAPRKRSSADDWLPSSSSAELDALKRRLAASREECKSLQEKLQKRKQEVNRMQHLAALVSEEAEKRLALTMKSWEAREVCCATLAHSVARCASANSAAQIRAHDTQMRAVKAQADTDRADFEARLGALSKDLNASKEAALQHEESSSELDALRAQVERLGAQLASERQQHAVEKQTIEAQLMATQQDLHTTQNSLQQKIMLLASNELLVAQCRQFVLNICHPGFSVVKDESLEPVDKNRGEPTGFVLIPLMVLLHGYALLPESERRDVIDTYEKKLATLK